MTEARGPSQPGFYWFKDHRGYAPEIAHIYLRADQPVVIFTGDWRPAPVSEMSGMWVGPLTVPEIMREEKPQDD